MDLAEFAHYIATLLICYFIGSFPTGVVLSTLKFKLDVRKLGSGNIGATNMTRAFGWGAGTITFVIDFLKGYFPLAVIRFIPMNPSIDRSWLIAVAGLSLILGHCFSVFLRFSGGKGVATGLGCVAYLNPVIAVASVTTYLIVLFITKISAVGSLSGLFTLWVCLTIIDLEKPRVVFLLSLSLIILLRHHGNIKRLYIELRNKK